MTAAVKYCGGCNPRYDRVAAVRKLEEQCPHVRLLPAGPGQGLTLLVCGCSAQCADLTGLTGRKVRRLWQDHP